ncbi:hypothetical protein QYE76_051558 [Lolium multiflorum]|uniref:Cathepsin propeptide inhibitor domain-containing protein n=1 Tax=Lolium multiflorum TaxID=4521 RepID=A0AAD8WI97_LOLMU|nr:hypothetical protein QYE76_051558 [Lolium multiflorum]
MASVTSKLSLATRFALRQFSHRLRFRLAGDIIFTIWTRPLFACANGAAGSPLDPRFLRCGLANLPAGEDSTRLPVGAEPEDLEDEYDDPYYPGDPATIFNYDERDLASEESLWALYERWCSFHKVARSHDEMRRRFDCFKTKARHIYEFNKSGMSYIKGLNHLSDKLDHEFFCRRVPLPSPSVYKSSHVFFNKNGEVTAFITDGILQEVNSPAPRTVKPVKMTKSPEI